MKLTNPEKLILTMLAEIHEKLGIKDGTNTKLLASAIYTNNTWALSWKMPGIVGDSPDPTPPEVSEVTNILDMWSIIEEAYEKFGPTEKARVKTEAEPFGGHVHFSGFDGNNESELMSIARFFVDDMGKFSRFKGRDLNSHHPSLATYRRMLGVFEPVRSTLVGHGLSVEKVVAILKAKRLPPDA